MWILLKHSIMFASNSIIAFPFLASQQQPGAQRTVAVLYVNSQTSTPTLPLRFYRRASAMYAASQGHRKIPLPE